MCSVAGGGGHVLIGLGLEHLLGHVPHEDCTLGTDRDDCSLIGRDDNLGDVARVANALVLASALIVVPELDSLVLTSGDEVLTRLSDGESVDFTSLRAIEHADSLAVEAVPVGNLTVRASRQHLRLIRVVEDLLEHARFKHAHHASVVHNVPDDGRAIIRGRNSLGIIVVDFDGRNSRAMLFHGTFHNLSLSADPPNADLTLLATRDDLLVVRGGANGSDAVVVGIVDGIEQFTRLRQESANLTIVPAGENGLAVVGEEDAVALEAGNLDSEELLSGLGVPHADVIE